jgi:hypothetical protein
VSAGRLYGDPGGGEWEDPGVGDHGRQELFASLFTVEGRPLIGHFVRMCNFKTPITHCGRPDPGRPIGRPGDGHPQGISL